MTENDAKQIGYDGFIDIDSEDNKLADDNSKIEADILREFNADELEQEWRVTVKKINDRTKKQETCFIMQPDELPTLFERLRVEFGPGNYRAYVQCNGVLKRNLGYSVAQPLSAPAAPSSNISDLGAVLAENNRQLMDFLRSEKQPPASADPMAMFTAMTAAMANMQKMFMPPPQDNSADAVTMLMKGIDLANKLQGRAGEKSLMDGLVEIVNSDVGRAAVEQLSSRKSAPTNSPTPQTLKENPIETPQITRELPSGLKNLPVEFIAQIEQQIKFWAFKASQDANPGLYAELALDTYPPEQIAGILERPDLQEIVFFFAPLAQNHWPWFETLRDEVREILTEPLEEEQNIVNTTMKDAPGNVLDGKTATSASIGSNENTGRTGGHSGDAGNNAPTGASGKNQP